MQALWQQSQTHIMAVHPGPTRGLIIANMMMATTGKIATISRYIHGARKKKHSNNNKFRSHGFNNTNKKNSIAFDSKPYNFGIIHYALVLLTINGKWPIRRTDRRSRATHSMRKCYAEWAGFIKYILDFYIFRISRSQHAPLFSESSVHGRQHGKDINYHFHWN